MRLTYLEDSGGSASLESEVQMRDGRHHVTILPRVAETVGEDYCVIALRGESGQERDTLIRVFTDGSTQQYERACQSDGL